MILSRVKPAADVNATDGTSKAKEKKSVPTLEEFLDARDYTGALTLLEFEKHTEKRSPDTDIWIAYCAFHLGDYKQAMEEYDKLTKKDNCYPDIWTYLGCCYFMLGMYPEAEKAAEMADEKYAKMPQAGKIARSL